MHILQINSSPRREASHSTRLADAIVARLQARYPVATVLQRNLAHSTNAQLDAEILAALFSPTDKLADSFAARLKARCPAAEDLIRNALAIASRPLLDNAAITAMQTPPEQRTPEQVARLALDDALIAEVQAADILVLGVPMYNLGNPVQLKTWIDSICRAGVTFAYTETGTQGLLKDKQVYIGLARGGFYHGTEADAQMPYLKALFGFLGLEAVHFVYAEGLELGPEAVQRAFTQADAEIAALLP